MDCTDPIISRVNGCKARLQGQSPECSFLPPEHDAKSLKKGSGGGEHVTNGSHKTTEANGDVSRNETSALAIPSKHADYYDDPDNVFGLWFCKPKWMQKFANKKAFLAVFCLTSVLQGMYQTYFVSVLTTIEKLYQTPSKTTGIIMSATEIGQIGGALLLTYYGGHGHRPKWIACGMLVFALASILCATPHFIFIDDSLLLASSSSSKNGSNSSKISDDYWVKLCHPHQSVSSNLSTTTLPGHLSVFQMDNDTFALPFNNYSLPQADALKSGKISCDSPNRSISQSRITHVVLTVFFVSLLLSGIGATAVYTLGIPYIDDNVATRESPLYFGITIGVRIFGPVFGFLLGSYCTTVYVNFPFETSNLTSDDPHWIGAWWLGVLIVGAALIFTSVPMMAFPRILPTSNSHNRAIVHHNGQLNGMVCSKHKQHQRVPLIKAPVIRRTQKEKPALKDFPSAIRRLLKNEILLYRTASSVLHILPIAGLYTFLPKYLESQFRLTSSHANMITGFAGILVMGIGIFASGTYMRKVKPTARFVAKWIALAALAYSIGMVILMWVGCPLGNYVGLNAGSEELEYVSTCSDSCQCRPGQFSPVCSDGVTYLSPCLAGCSSVTGQDKPTFSDCSCIGHNSTLTNGFCPLECNNLIWYIIIFSFFVLIHSTSEVGSMLLTLRCVDTHDKALALGLIQFAIGLFGNVPCPIIYGAVVDSACLFWEDNCGEPGACRVYDPSKFRMVFHGVTAVIMFVAFLVDAIVWYKASSIHIQEDDEVVEPDETTAAITDGQQPQVETSV